MHVPQGVLWHAAVCALPMLEAAFLWQRKCWEVKTLDDCAEFIKMDKIEKPIISGGLVVQQDTTA